MIEYNYYNIIERIVETSLEKLNAWEHDFINDIYEKHVLNQKELTPSQEAKILEINRKLVGRQ